MILKKYMHSGVLLLFVILLLACNGNQEQKESEEKTESPELTQDADMELSRKQMETVGITVGPLEEKNLNAIVKANGQLAVPPQNKADVSVLTGGIIRTITVLEGQQVKKGQVLATLENQDLIRIQQDYLSARNNFSFIEAEHTRQQLLKAAGAGTGKSYQLAEANYDAERSKISAYESQLKQMGLSPSKISTGNIYSIFPLTSPISGTVGQITVNLGAYVVPGTSILEVVDNSKIHCDLVVFEKDLMKVKTGQTVNFMLTNQDNLPISGTITGINKSFENENKGVIVHAVINNTAHMNLIPGMYVTALISVGQSLTRAVPVDAVIRSEGREYIFVVTENNQQGYRFKKVEVKTGVSELGYIEVKALSELASNTQIANRGAFYLQSKFTGGDTE